MALNCEICGIKNTSRKDRYCRKHQKTVLRRLEQVGYLEPLKVTTVDGVQKLSRQRFLTLQDGPPPTMPT